MWKTVKKDGDIHVLPVDDRTGHTVERSCQCKPRFKTAKGNDTSSASPVCVVVVHNDFSEGRNAA